MRSSSAAVTVCGSGNVAKKFCLPLRGISSVNGLLVPAVPMTSFVRCTARSGAIVRPGLSSPIFAQNGTAVFIHG
ncbi:MAG: hypothetical protein ACR2KS_04620 [Candidatus Eremiobacter antarcticus]|nr:hypothetical protein [Candidatus Eremiobacteraeota bacterium]MBC5807672.1 hypothetical protein [Candidatus Eremiobacteraeota bacterium]